ncbi:MAG TPA: hypothetical protein VF278_14690 [Pirellulales bacterium]
MRNFFIDGLPGFDSRMLNPELFGPLLLRAQGSALFLRCSRFMARISAQSGEVVWLIERHPAVTTISESTSKLPRHIRTPLWPVGFEVWYSETNDVIAELLPTEDGSALVSARDAATGRSLWEHFIPIPAPAIWAEGSPAWPGAQTEEIDAFFGSDPTCLVVCLSRQSRRSMYYSPTITVNTLPQYACQLDAIRLDVLAGTAIWRATFPGVSVGIVERQSFVGVWSSTCRWEPHHPAVLPGAEQIGVLDFETGINQILHECGKDLGWPIHDGAFVAVPWHSRGDVGVMWLDERGKQLRQVRWQQSKVNSTRLHHTGAGLALQVNDQTLAWLGEDDPLWTVRAKPYIYKVHCRAGSDVFVATDGRGGRLLAFDPVSGRETLNLKPLVGGAGSLTKVPGHDLLVASFATSRANSLAGELLVLSMRDHAYQLDRRYGSLLGVWEHGALCLAGKKWERLAIVDLRCTP